jgi:hypothetical protein
MAYFMNPSHGDCYAKLEHVLVVPSSGCISRDQSLNCSD